MLVSSYQVYDLLTEKAVTSLALQIPFMSVDQKNQWIYSKAFYDKQFFMDFFLSHWQMHRGEKIEPCSVHHEIDEAYES